MEEKIKYRGIGFLSLLTLLFVYLKLTGVISWSWFWVLAPKIIPLSIVMVIILVIGFLLLFVDSKERKEFIEELKKSF